MLKTKAILEVKIGERIYELQCASDSPLGELHDALMQMKGFTVDKMVAAHKDEQALVQAQQAPVSEDEKALQPAVLPV